jgi:hypothetical protein
LGEMKKNAARIWMSILFLMTLSGCGPEAVFIPDIAFTMEFDKSGEASLSREFPDMKRVLAREGYRSSLFYIDSSPSLWETDLALKTADLFVWAPLRGPEAVRFHQAHPETSGLWLALGDNPLADSVPENLAVVMPRREKAWTQLNSVLNKEGYHRVAGIFSALAAGDPGVEDFISPNLEWFFSLTGTNGPEEALEFLKNRVSGEADLIILAAGEANPRLYQELMHWKIPLVLEAPFPGAESNSMVKGLLVTDWTEGFKTVREGGNQPSGGLLYFNSSLWWREENVLQPRE